MENLLVSIISFRKLHVGGFVKEKFELEGIECFLTDEGFDITDDNVPKGFKLKVGLNDTEKAINVLEYAFGIAEKTDAEVKLLYVYVDPTQTGPVKHTTSWQEHERIEAAETYKKAQTNLLKFRDKLKQQIDKKIIENTKMHFALLKGRPENIIVAVCKRKMSWQSKKY